MQLPVIQLVRNNLPAAWEAAVLKTWYDGAAIETQYDRPDDPISRDASVFITVEDPFAEPRIHRAMPGGIYDLEVYRQEVVDGIHDYWIAPDEGKWSYTYSERMNAYTIPYSEGAFQSRVEVDQVQYVVDTLSDCPHSRRAQIVIWKPWEDTLCDHSPCLQRLWFRIFDDHLVMSAHMRSNDAYKAAFMNMFAFTDLQRDIAERISVQCGREIKVGQYNHIVDSFHIYGSYFDEFKGFIRSAKTRTWEDRTYRTEDVQVLFDEAREKIAASL